MKKYAISSVNENPEYLFFAPLWSAFWSRLGYEPHIIMIDKYIPEELKNLVCSTTKKNNGEIIKLNHIEGYKTCNVSQISRLYASCVKKFKDDDYIITDDIDKFVVSKPWFNQQDFTKDIHIYDFDETNYTRLKIGYIGMKVNVWKEIIPPLVNKNLYENIKECLDANIKNEQQRDNYVYKSQREKEVDIAWNLDETMLTQGVLKSKYYPDSCQLICRGGNHYGLRNGRIDRTAWKQTFIQYITTRIIDVHLHRKPYDEEIWGDVKTIMAQVFTQEQISSFDDYRNNFIGLIE